MPGGGTFIDDGTGAEWADLLRHHPFPFIADERDGECFRNLPAMAFKRLLDAGQQCPERDCGQPAGTVCTFALCPGKRPAVSAPFHENPNSPEAQHNHD